MTSRRSFLRVLGLTPVAAPLAAKAAADKAASDLIGLGSMPSPSPGYGISGGSPVQTVQDWKTKVLRFLSSATLPDWVEEELRYRNRFVGYIDPDIACKRSWSLNVKIATQRDRNIERSRLEVREGPRRGLRSREFEEKYGVWI